MGSMGAYHGRMEQLLFVGFINGMRCFENDHAGQEGALNTFLPLYPSNHPSIAQK